MTDGTDENSLRILEEDARSDGRPEAFGATTLALVAEIRRLRAVVEVVADADPDDRICHLKVTVGTQAAYLQEAAQSVLGRHDRLIGDREGT